MTRALRIALAGGGTGGHLVPALGLLRHGVAGGRVESVHWFTTGRPVETRVLGDLAEVLGVPATTSALRLEGPRGAPGRLRQAVDLPRAVLRARRELRAFRPDVLIGTGGFGSTPGVLAARLCGVPVVLLEVNARPGTAVRWLGPLSAAVCHSMAGSLPIGAPAGGRHRHTGPPLPPVLDEQTEREGDRTGDPDGAATGPRLLVLGGSQGAGGLNAFVARSAQALVAAGVHVVHQVGPGRLGEGAAGLVAGPGSYGAHEYLDGVPDELRRATVVLCRGGAATLVEVAAARTPAVVVPYPHHTDRHQWHNALELGAGARIVEESSLAADPEALCNWLVQLCGAGGARDRDRMAAALAGALRPNGSAAIFDAIDDVLVNR
ncbi:UDP-N-acetylglucosamine--N-acetylmuramyl-(pentapeptide) pyrophosphoryl-undecaprenol N-acetylglucosamine transferase MurG [Planctomycetes bacterium Pla163]|uniref:UDP-N-acetylglucosamine--N-acetylmuramyl-(pentapeptide) pyrophosphoryl-undecaprenol N-acetylglucosamine transferase n=1 Tax=Rohdeia mirabilis TaxID=2528008 RepID=A0A518CYK1_9BACT|nr:UDP-N-acetylglucosamine--N-acetylmuramyl-(pentapeptide) pyrophosphoryl-undecaprenol N-acetylglucosamine transferase MurG [Planctomycetes bacterium Pla163]